MAEGSMQSKGLLRQKDIEQALLLEEKMALQLRLLAAAGLDPPSPPSYRHLVSENVDTGQMWKEVLMAVQEVSQLASSLYTTGTNLSRSVSSAGEHQSDNFVSPILPKRAETFGGFDNCSQGPLKLLTKKISAGTPAGTPDLDNLKPGDSRIFERLPYRNCVITGGPFTNGNILGVNIESQNQQSQQAQPQQQQNLQQITAAPDGSTLLSLGREQQYAAIQLSHYVYTLLCIISQLMTTNESLQAHLASLKVGPDSKHYRHNQQLEELRNLQDKLSGEKAAWLAMKDQEEKALEQKKSELLRLQEQIKAEQNDIKQQRDQLYRKMEVLTSQGLLISPNVAIPVAGLTDDNSSKETSEDSSPQSDTSSAASAVSSTASGISSNQSSTVDRRRDPKRTKSNAINKSQLPLNLISATNQQKVSREVSIKQQIPFKLVSKLGGEVTKCIGGPQQMLPLKLSQEEKTRRSSTSGYHRLGSDNSFSPPSGETTPTSVMYAHSRTGSSPAMMQGSPPNSAPSSQCQSPGSAKATRTHTYPKLPDKFKIRNDQQSPAEEEVIYF